MNKLKLIEIDCKNIEKSINPKLFLGKKILILGGNGFLASYLLYFFFYLNKKNKKKIKVTASSLNKPKNILKLILKKNKNFSFKKINLTNSKLLEKKFKKKYDFIFYMATYGQPYLWLKNEIDTFKLNSNTLLFFLKKAKQDKSKLMYFSSGDIYGQNNTTVNEDSKSIVDLNEKRIVYGESKRIGETLCRIYQKNNTSNIFVVRPGHTYGPGMQVKDKRVVVELIQKGLKSNVKLLDDGKAKKTFGYISDITTMFLRIISEGKGNIYNTTGKSFISILSIAKIIAKKLNKNVIFSKSSESHVNTGQKFIKIKSKNYEKEFGKIKYISIDKGITKTIQWFKKK